jgi:hypothetical protein
MTSTRLHARVTIAAPPGDGGITRPAPVLPLHALALPLSSLAGQLTLLVAMVGVLLWVLLFSGHPAVHDELHSLRHSLYALPCH